MSAVTFQESSYLFQLRKQKDRNMILKNDIFARSDTPRRQEQILALNN